MYTHLLPEHLYQVYLHLSYYHIQKIESLLGPTLFLQEDRFWREKYCLDYQRHPFYNPAALPESVMNLSWKDKYARVALFCPAPRGLIQADAFGSIWKGRERLVEANCLEIIDYNFCAVTTHLLFLSQSNDLVMLEQKAGQSAILRQLASQIRLWRKNLRSVILATVDHRVYVIPDTITLYHSGKPWKYLGQYPDLVQLKIIHQNHDILIKVIGRKQVSCFVVAQT